MVDIHEDEEHEFKNWTFTKNFEFLINTLQEYICAFTNTNGGTIYMGIRDDGRVIGVYCDRAMMDRIRLGIDRLVRERKLDMSSACLSSRCLTIPTKSSWSSRRS